MSDSVSSEVERLRQFLADSGFNFAQDIRATYVAPEEYAVFVPAHKIQTFSRPGQVTSLRQMKKIQKAVFAATGLKVDWVVIPSEAVVELEHALLDLLRVRFPGTVKAVQISSLNRPPIWVWLEAEPQTAQAASRPTLDTINEATDALFKAYGHGHPSVAFLDGPELPSTAVILRWVKTIAPATTEQISERLQTAGATHPGPDWLQKQLDKLRRSGKVTRTAAGTYVLTEAGLRVVPHGRTRTSSDIQRALALGRRRW